MTRLLFILLLSALLSFACGPAHAQGEAEVVEALQEVLDDGPAAEDEGAAADPESLQRLAELELQAGEVLKKPPPQTTLEDSSLALKEILARPEFASEAEKLKQTPSLIERFLNWLGGIINIQPGSNSAWLISLTIVLSLLVIYLIVRLIWEMLARRRSGTAGQAGAALSFESGFDALLAASRKALAAADYRNALRYRYLASLSQLDLPASALLTNSQILRVMRKRHPGIGSSLGQMVQRFEDVWYGGADCSAADFNVLDSLATEVEDVAIAGREA